MITKLKIAIVFIMLKIYEILGAYCLICVLPYMVGYLNYYLKLTFITPLGNPTGCIQSWGIGIFSLLFICIVLLTGLMPCMVIWSKYPIIHNNVVNWINNNWDKARDIVNKN